MFSSDNLANEPGPARPGSKVPGSRKVDLARSILSLGLSRNMATAVVQHFVGILCQLLIYRTLIASEGIEILGLWSLTLGIAGFAKLADFTGGSSLARFVAVARERTSGPPPQDYIDSVILFILGLYATITLIAWYPFTLLVHQVSGSTDGINLGALVGFALFSLILSASTGSQLSAIGGLQRSDIRSGIIILGWIVYLSASMYAIPQFGLLGLAVAQIGQQLLVLFLARLALMHRISQLGLLPLNFSRAALRETMAYGVKLQFNALLQVSFDPLCKLLIGWAGGMGALGVYEIALRIGGNTRTLAGVATGPLVPAFAKASVDRSRRAESVRLLGRVQAINVPATIGLLMLVVLLSPAFSIFMLGRLDVIFIHLVIGFALASVAHAMAFPLQAMSQGEGRLLGNILSTLGMAVGAQAFIPVTSYFVGQDYAGLGVAGAIMLGATISMFTNIRIFKIPVAIAIPWRPLVPLLASLLATSALAVFMSSWLAG